MAKPVQLVKNAIKYGVAGFGVTYCTLRYVCGLTVCEGNSMTPVIEPGDIVLNSPLFVDNQWLHKGDVVFCRSPKDPKGLICKRLKGLEGDLIYNNEKLIDEYVGKGHVWLEGDNQELSIDSRSYGSVPYGLLVSKGCFRVWPLHRIGFISFPDEDEEKLKLKTT